MGRGRRKPAHAKPAHAKPASGSSATARLTPDGVILGLAGLGLLITAYLTGSAWFGRVPAFCAEGSGCDLVQQSPWSSLLGLPIALWGFLLFALTAMFAYQASSRLKRWRRLWFVAVFGISISLYLNAVVWFALGSYFVWGLGSLAILGAILFAVWLRRPVSAPGMAWTPWLLRSASLGLVAVLALHLYASDLLRTPESPRLAALATHLEASGARYYGASWCPACQNQHRIFGAAAERLPYVECSPRGRGTPMAAVCANAGITSYPTWIIEGRRYQEVISAEELEVLSGFDWENRRR